MGLFKKSIKNTASVFPENRYTGNQKVWLLSSIAAISLLCGIGFLYYSSSKSNDIRQKKNYVSVLNGINENIEKHILLSNQGDLQAFDNLEKEIKQQDKIINILKNGGELENFSEKIKSSNEIIKNQVSSYEKFWKENKIVANSILEQKNNFTELNLLIDRAKPFNNNIIDSSNKLLLLSKNSNRNTERLINEINYLINKTLLIDNVLLSNNIKIQDIYSISKDLKSISKYINILKEGSNIYDVPAVGGNLANELKNLEQNFSIYANLTPKISQTTPFIYSNFIAQKLLSSKIKNLNQELIKVDKVLDGEIKRIFILQILSLVGFISMGVSIGYLSNIFYNERNKAVQYASQLKKNQANETAVQALLKQMNPIDSGDLTHSINIQDKFIEPIAKRVDNTRKTLQSIITEIKKVTFMLTTTSNDTNKLSIEVLKRASNQLELMDETISNIGKMTSQMDEIAQKTWFVKETAILSEQVSKDGLVTVNQAINKMEQIRENIQESAKKIKRLGETSQAIVGVTDIMRHISKEVNVLALNAAIQATNTGEGGKAFSIMAQEVQRLAENSTEASKQIDDLIKDIQIDTQAAVSAMEKTTQEVVEGTNLSDKAGKILNNIANESEKLAKQISDVASQIEEKSSQMVDISLKVRKLQESNNENTEKVQASVEKIQEMHKNSGNLNNVISKYVV